MPIQIGESEYKCTVCGKIYGLKEGVHGSPVLRARACENSHKVIYFPIERDELGKLIQFIYSKDEKLISEKLFRNLLKYYNTHAEE